MVAESLAAKVLVAQAFVLEHDAHRPVEDRDPLLKQLIEALSHRSCHRHR
jgi:hypothetical protein